MKRIYFQLIISIFTVSVLAVSCRKNQDKNDAAEIAQQSSLAQRTMNDIGVMTTEAILESFQSFAATCATLTYDTTGVSKEITIDFGTTDCVCADGKTRTGKLMISAPTGFVGFGSKITTATSNYVVNGNEIVGSRTITLNNAENSSVNSAVTITLPEERGEFTWNGNFNRKYISGDNTPYILDDNYELTGTANGVNTKDIEYEIDVTEALVTQIGCRWIKGGIITISASSMKEDATLDYGDGDCDNKALLNYIKKEKTITI